MALAIPTVVLVRHHVTYVRRRAWFGKSNQEKFESSWAFSIAHKSFQGYLAQCEGYTDRQCLGTWNFFLWLLFRGLSACHRVGERC